VDTKEIISCPTTLLLSNEYEESELDDRDFDVVQFTDAPQLQLQRFHFRGF
jgi:hypothetical protein